MNRTKIFLLALAGMMAVACATDPVDECGGEASKVAIAKKFVNTADNAAQGELIIYVSESAAEKLLAAEVSTRSGVTALDEAAVALGAVEV